MVYTTQSAQATQKLGEQLAVSLKKSDKGRAVLIGLVGDLGSGKTTFTSGFARGLGIAHRMLSPTFIIVRRYDIEHQFFHYLFHIDVYRMHSGVSIDAKDLENLGIDEIIADSKNICVIEWVDKAPYLQKMCDMTIRFEMADENTRKIEIQNC